MLIHLEPERLFHCVKSVLAPLKGAFPLQGLQHSSSLRWQNDWWEGAWEVPNPASPSEQGWHQHGSAVALLGDPWKPPRVAIWISANTVLGEDEVLTVEIMYTC